MMDRFELRPEITKRERILQRAKHDLALAKILKREADIEEANERINEYTADVALLQEAYNEAVAGENAILSEEAA